MTLLTKAERRHAIRTWTRKDAIRQAKAIRTRQAQVTEARFFAGQADKDTWTVLHGANVLNGLPLACKLPEGYFERNGFAGN
jgi:hypothetical protein